MPIPSSLSKECSDGFSGLQESGVQDHGCRFDGRASLIRGNAICIPDAENDRVDDMGAKPVTLPVRRKTKSIKEHTDASYFDR
ncbi:hypothetical protein GCM10023156_25350 [Novipirellula rosea]|uniref:Uncharacterized protein n=1 Tax=Novipirellula rosea TaxID=1031540 RepID=A0ABP8MQS6_9BACT